MDVPDVPCPTPLVITSGLPVRIYKQGITNLYHKKFDDKKITEFLNNNENDIMQMVSSLEARGIGQGTSGTSMDVTNVGL